ncbi:hypothetical protein BH11PSE12_BH11PSE12_08220 [soil metagenome]
MTLSIGSAHKQWVSNARRAHIDNGTGPGKIKYYPDPRPASGDTPTVTMLCQMLLAKPCGTVDPSGLHLTTSAPAQATGSGIIRWARITDSDDNFIMDGDVRMVSDADIAIADFVIDVARVLTGSFINLVASSLAEGG